MKLKNYLIISFLLAVVVLLSSCGNSEKENTFAEEYKNIYKTVVQYSGENDSTSKYLEIAERSAELIPLLEENEMPLLWRLITIRQSTMREHLFMK